MTFSSEMETELSTHIKTLAEQFHGLTRKLIVEYALRNNVTVPDSWQQNGMTGKHFGYPLKKETIKQFEHQKLARASAFNRYNIDKFYDNLKDGKGLHKFECHDIYNANGTECTTVKQSENVVVAEGVKKVGSITSAERGHFVTVVHAVNAAGSVVPSLLIFPRKNNRDYLIEVVLQGVSEESIPVDGLMEICL
ncbi:uncharacterized protein LOC115215129 [Octopus sinensis]|uniref:Uncharacterized protein LOC115215129 n=1 Tax=Octopus sinensis TaxID=2607531 RepID=A0A6P7SPW8_9MOLL|nr:uncharacterized protein LOC115215129 [Octopus sinensis]